jgi:GAF domain-containing protein
LFDESGDESAWDHPALTGISGGPAKWGQGPFPDALRSSGMQFFASYPIRSGNHLLGHLALAGKSPKSVSEAQEEFVCALCEMIGVAVMTAQLRDQSNKLSEDLIALQELNKIISQSLNLGGYHSENCGKESGS